MLLDFNSDYYLNNNPDVADAVKAGDFSSAQEHWEQFGAKEERNPNAYFNTQAYLAANPDVADDDINPLTHYLMFGADEGRSPSASFDTEEYLTANPDVAKAVEAGDFQSGYEHWVTFGASEGRAPSDSYQDAAENFDEKAYLDDNPDVAKAIEAGDFQSGYEHWVLFGQYEDERPQPSFDGGNNGNNGNAFSIADAIAAGDKLPDDYTLEDTAKNLLKTEGEGKDETLIHLDILNGADGISVTDEVTVGQAAALAAFKSDSTDFDGEITIPTVTNDVEADDLDSGYSQTDLDGLSVDEVVSDFSSFAKGSDKGGYAGYENASADTTFSITGTPESSQDKGADSFYKGGVLVEGLESGDTLKVNLADNAADSYYSAWTVDDASSASDAQSNDVSINVESGNDGVINVGGATTDITVTGEGDLGFNDYTNSRYESVDASGASGDIRFGNIDLSDSSGDPATGLADDATIKTGSGEDQIDLSTLKSDYSGEVTVDAGAGDDVITVGSDGEFTLTGGDGDDTFVFAAVTDDVIIADFATGEDTIDLSAIIRDPGTTFESVADAASVNGAGDFFFDDSGSEEATLTVGLNQGQELTITMGEDVEDVVADDFVEIA